MKGAASNRDRSRVLINQTCATENAGRLIDTCFYFLLFAAESRHWHPVDATEIWLFTRVRRLFSHSVQRMKAPPEIICSDLIWHAGAP
ncbi:cupin domain-containing protein [Roseobacter fucihabitans]|uniref:cupin domain-containing protein n=1 Tax=Roseobacter fucihabitans TaxID=1537242 RepID=UPI003312FE7E